MIRITIRIYAKYWFISTISVQIAINQFVCICKSLPCRIIIPTPKIVQSRFYIIDIPPIAERLDGTQCGSERTGGGERLTPRIVSIFYHFGAGAVNQTDNIALEVMNVNILRPVELHNSGAVLGVIPEVEGVAALGHVHDVLAMQNVVGNHAVDRFPYPQTLCIVDEGSCGSALAHLLELAAILPGVGPGAVGQGIANIVVGNRRAIEGGELVLPVAIAVGIGDRLEGGADSAGGVGVPLLTQNIPAPVVGVDPGGARGAAGGIVLVVDPDQKNTKSEKASLIETA